MGSNINTMSLHNSSCKVSGIYNKTNPLKNDVFFKASNLSKPYNLTKAKSQKDIPDDANIFLFTPKSSVYLPEGRSAKECILSDKGFGFWTKFFGGEEANTMRLKRNDVDYAHGDLIDERRVSGVIEVDDSKVNQIENVTMVKLKNNADVRFIDKVDELDAFDSNMGEVTVSGSIHLNGNTSSDKLRAYTVVAYPGDKIGDVKSNLLACKSDVNLPNRFTEIGNAVATEGAEVSQTKIKKLKTKDLMFNNSLGGDVEAVSALEFNNSVVDHLKLSCVKKMSGCKIKKFDFTNVGNELKLYDKIQIDELNLDNEESKLFVFPKTEWGNKSDSYIKNINIKTDVSCPNPRPKLKIQGDINIERVMFHNSPGVLELTRPKDPERPIKVINGIVTYNVPSEPVPEIDDLDV